MDGSLWSSIVEKAKPLIPSIDVNCSSPENEGMIEIFQRPPELFLKLPEDSDEDFDKFSMDKTEIKEPFKIKANRPGSTAVELNGHTPDSILKPNEKDTKYSTTGDLVLSFARLEQLDDINVKEDELVKPKHCVAEVGGATYNDCDKYHADENIMEKLVAYCEQQFIRKNNMKSKSEVSLSAQLNTEEPPTVYIDLRWQDHATKPPTKPQTRNSVYKETPPAKEDNHKEQTGAQTHSWEETGKSMLLRKLREHKEINKCANKKHSAINGKREDERLPQLTVSTERCDLQNQPEDRQPTCVKPVLLKPKMDNQKTNQITKTQRAQQQRQYQHIITELEKRQPTKSVRQKQAAAEKTDLLYEIEASHLEPITTLPADIENEGHMLLIVNLSSPGMVAQRAQGKRKVMESALTKSHIYNTLVAWFLSLVGPNPPSNNEANTKVPFWVAGLQQLWTENGLALHVLAVARHPYTQRRRDSDIHTPFYNHVCRFLSETSVPTIAHWLSQLQDLTDKDTCSPPICLPLFNLNSFITATSNKKVISRIFSLGPGFYWQTVETPEHVCKGRETTQELHTEVSTAMGCKSFLQFPLITHYTLQSILDSGLDVCGLRLLYPPSVFLGNIVGHDSFIQRGDEPHPVLAIAVRGPYAHSLLKGINTSIDHMLRKMTSSVELLSCTSEDPPLLYTPQLCSQVHKELCLCFSGRLPKESGNNQKQSLKRDQVTSGDASFLCATTKADILLVVSPVVPPCCYGQVLATCECRGFVLRGLQRMQLHDDGATLLGLTNLQTQVFCSLPRSDFSDCLVLILKKENAHHHSITLPAALMRELKAQNLLACLRSRGDGVPAVETSLCFHTVPYSNNLYYIFARSAWAIPDPSTVVLSNQKCPPASEKEQVVLTLCGQDMSQGLSLLHRALTQHGFELLGLKWLPALTRLQAQEVSPYEVGEQFSHSTLAALMSAPALVCSLKRVDAFASLKDLLPNDYHNNVLMSPTPQVASRQSSLFFLEHEIINYPPKLLTVCVFNPRVWNENFSKILCILHQTGLMLVGLRVLVLSKSDAATLLPAGNDSDSVDHLEYLCSGSSLALCLQGENAVKRLLEVLGSSDLSTSIVGHDKSQFYNGVYGAESYEKAIQDVKRLFPEGLCCTQTRTMRKEQILSMHAECAQSSTSKENLSTIMALGLNGVSVMPSGPWQTTCLLLPFHVPLLSQVPSHLDVLKELQETGCHLVAGRMTVLDREQRTHVAKVLGISSSENEKMALLECPCLIVVLKGDCIVSNLNSVLESIYKDKPGLEKLGGDIIYPESETKATQLICFLFDSLSSD